MLKSNNGGNKDDFKHQIKKSIYYLLIPSHYMSLKIAKADVSRKDWLTIKDDCFIEGPPSDYGPPSTLFVYGETQNSLFIPFAYAKNRFKKSPNKTYPFPTTNYKFIGQFRNNEQKLVFGEAVKQLKMNRSCLLSLHTGFGKTWMAIRLAKECGLKAAILAHRGILFEQWIKEIQKFTTATYQRMDTKGELNPDVDFYIFNVAYVHKLWDMNKKKWGYKRLGIYKDIGLLIVDEAHVVCAQEMSKALLFFQPRMLIGLTATPQRKDGMDKLLDLYFGESRITRISQHEFTVYRLPTDIKPEYTLNAFGKKNWNSVIEYLVTSAKRNEIIVNVAVKFSHKKILILTKRKAHCDELYARLLAKKQSVTVMKGNDKEYDIHARILISTYSKLGVGFDNPKLNMFIVACDVVEIEQYAGRLRHNKNKHRVIVDLVDKDSSCNNHWLTRRKWYKSRNGTIKNYYTAFPEEKPKTLVLKKGKKRLAPKIN